jgi:hypothetical protein
MRVAHERQKQSAEKWMGCKGALDFGPDRRQHLKNSKRDEEVDLKRKQNVARDFEFYIYF